jgi:adenine-specific DNA-methyltransferase
MSQNATDGGNRRFVTVQLPELIDPANKEQKAASDYCDKIGKPRTIAELTKDRLRRAGKKIKDENPLFARRLGFPRLQTRFHQHPRVAPEPREPRREPRSLRGAPQDRRTEQDILFELLLKLGLDLCVPMETKNIAGHEVHSIGVGTLLACLSKSISQADVEPLAEEIIAWHKEQAPAGEPTVVFRDSAFADDVAKTNLAAILKQNGLETVRSL